MNFKMSLILCFFILFPTFNTAQSSDSILAKIGNEKITKNEFKNRFELMPHLNYPTKNIDSLKEFFLYSLVAEKLWYSEAVEKGIDTSAVIRNSINALKNLIIKDEVFRKEVESKVTFSDFDLAKGMNRINKNLYVNVIKSKDSIEIKNIYNLLYTGKDFDSLLILREEFKYQTKPIKVSLGSLDDEKAEDIVFNLGKNELSPILFFKNQWYIFKLIRYEADSTIALNTDETKNKVKIIITERRRREVGGRFIDNILGGKSINANGNLLKYLIEKLLALLETKLQNRKDSLSNPELNEFDYYLLMKTIEQEKLNAVLFKVDSYPYTLTDFIYYLIYQKLNIDIKKPYEMKGILQSALKDFIESSVIVQFGKMKNYDTLPSVQDYLKSWITFYYSESMMQSIADSVKKSSAGNNYNLINDDKSERKKTQVNIAEILTKNISVVEKILDEIQKGNDFTEIARRYNERENTKKSNGIWGYFVADYAGEIGEVAAKLNAGEVYGPIKTDEGYSFIKLLDKRVLSDSLLKKDDENKEFEKMKFSYEKLNKILNKKTRKLFEKYNPEINTEILKSLEVSSLNTFTYRLIGFGGKIAAFPITIPLYEWKKEIKKNINVP